MSGHISGESTPKKRKSGFESITLAMADQSNIIEAVFEEYEEDQSDDDDEIDNNQMSTQQKIMISYNSCLAVIHHMTLGAFFLVIPYYVLSTPKYGWTERDLGVIFGVLCIGIMVGSQSISITSFVISNASLKIFIAHLSQLIAGIIGWILVSSVFGFNYPLFMVGSFLLGVTSDGTTVQSYGDLISSGNEEIELRLMKNIGLLTIVTNILCALLFPGIYDNAGYIVFCSVSFGIQCIGLLILLLLWHSINRKPTGDRGDDECEVTLPGDYSIMESNIPLIKVLSPSMFVLILITFISALSYAMYGMASPIIHALEWNISSSVGGYLSALSNIFSFVLLNLSLRYPDKCILFKYPFNIIMSITIFIAGTLMYLIVFEPFIAYSFHWIMSQIFRVVFGSEMVARLFLCPRDSFVKITLVNGFVQSMAYLIGSAVTPILISINVKLPFLVMAVMNGVLVAVILVVFYQRKSYLTTFYDDISVSNYLQYESEFYDRQRKSNKKKYEVQKDFALYDKISCL